MNNPVYNLIVTTDRWFVLVAVVVSLVIGMFRYGPKLFWNHYMKRMRFPTDMAMGDEQKKSMMMHNLIYETISRILYFMWLAQALAVGGWTDMMSGLVFAVVVWLLFVFSTQLSQITRSMVDKKVIWILSGKVLFETLIATVIWFSFF